MSPQKQTYFLHIPKTAGQSFRQVIEEQFPDTQIAPIYTLPQAAIFVQEQGKEALENYQLICGHLGFGFTKLLPQAPRVITMLRNPVDRTISYFNFVKRRPQNPMHQVFFANDIGIEEFLDHPEAKEIITNFQVNDLTLDFDFNQPINGPDGQRLKPRFGRISSDLSDVNRLELAKERLESFEFVGVTEAFAESMELMLKTFDWQTKMKPPVVNTSPKGASLNRHNISKSALQKVEDYTSLDAELYKLAENLFNQRKKELGRKSSIFSGLTKIFRKNSKANQNKPDFLGIGAQKAGTTWLYKHLNDHPEIYFPKKEIHFWDLSYDKGLDWYREFFSKPEMTQGEITPAYASLPKEKIKEIYELNPYLKVIYIIRNQIDRAWSAALMEIDRKTFEHKSDTWFKDQFKPGHALSDEDLALQSEAFEKTADSWFVDKFNSKEFKQKSDYETSIKNWLEFFPKDQILILNYDDISREPLAFLKKCADHISVDQGFFDKIEDDHLKKPLFASSKYPIRESLKEVLQDIYGADMKNTQKLLVDNGLLRES